ncbi:MAG: transcriptional repressor [Clostridium sp.]|nr:transcriptional repressor [Clostridium sp.]MCM1171556.1 transcriptional repressor [Clostridium sp.]MCM1208829.1 transcriptional repressor [Ruminococcus sp.]
MYILAKEDDALEKTGYSTDKKNKILECLKNNANSDMTVKDIEAYLLNQLDTKVNIATIYRNLDKLEKNGCVLRHTDEAGNKSTYQYAGSENKCHKHIHMKCSTCGQVYHMDCDFMEELERHMYEHHGFILECKTSMIYGTCKNCSSQNFDNNVKIET